MLWSFVYLAVRNLFAIIWLLAALSRLLQAGLLRNVDGVARVFRERLQPRGGAGRRFADHRNVVLQIEKCAQACRTTG